MACERCSDYKKSQVLEEFLFFKRRITHDIFYGLYICQVNRFSKCDVCTQLKQSIEKTNEKEARQALHQQREDHLILQK